MKRYEIGLFSEDSLRFDCTMFGCRNDSDALEFAEARAELKNLHEHNESPWILGYIWELDEDSESRRRRVFPTQSE